MQLELKDEKGLIGTIDLPVEELKEALGLGSVSELRDKLSDIEGKLAELAEDDVTDPTPEEQATNWLAETKRILPEMEDGTLRQILTDCGKGQLLQAAEVSELEPEAEEVREGKVEEEGWVYLERTNRSYKLPTAE